MKSRNYKEVSLFYSIWEYLMIYGTVVCKFNSTASVFIVFFTKTWASFKVLASTKVDDITKFLICYHFCSLNKCKIMIFSIPGNNFSNQIIDGSFIKLRKIETSIQKILFIYMLYVDFNQKMLRLLSSWEVAFCLFSFLIFTHLLNSLTNQYVKFRIEIIPTVFLMEKFKLFHIRYHNWSDMVYQTAPYFLFIVH